MGWEAFLAKFCNLQDNEFLNTSEVALLGHIDCSHLQDKSKKYLPSDDGEVANLRKLVYLLDQAVYSVCRLIFDANLIPIVIGGGHNNAYPIIKAASHSFDSAIGAVNLDPHTDFRATEGRHSGNGFSYATQEGYLNAYYSIGMHELKNSQDNLAHLAKQGFKYTSYQDIWIRKKLTFHKAIEKGLNYLQSNNAPFGIELDVDCISMMPASAYTNCGITVQEAEQYTYQCAQQDYACYLHIAEGAPIQHPNGLEAGINDVGQVYSALVSSFIMGKQEAK